MQATTAPPLRRAGLLPPGQAASRALPARRAAAGPGTDALVGGRDGSGPRAVHQALAETVPFTGRRHHLLLPLGVELAMGEASFRSFISQQRKAGKILSRRSSFKWEVVTVDDDTPNAFVLPGGKVVVHSGLLRLLGGRRDLLATVLGHEVAHAVARHGAEKQRQAAASAAAAAEEEEVTSLLNNVLLQLPFSSGGSSSRGSSSPMRQGRVATAAPPPPSGPLVLVLLVLLPLVVQGNSAAVAQAVSLAVTQQGANATALAQALPTATSPTAGGGRVAAQSVGGSVTAVSQSNSATLNQAASAQAVSAAIAQAGMRTNHLLGPTPLSYMRFAPTHLCPQDWAGPEQAVGGVCLAAHHGSGLTPLPVIMKTSLHHTTTTLSILPGGA
eukprot:XP_001694136.1 metalloprotease [Chlamydomonas reinhardtii]